MKKPPLEGAQRERRSIDVVGGQTSDLGIKNKKKLRLKSKGRRSRVR